MSWSAIETLIRAEAEKLRDAVPNLIWLLAVTNRPSGTHVTYSMLIESTVPMEIGANLQAEPYADRTTGRLQFDIYAPVGAAISESTGTADAIRAHFRGLRVSTIRFETPTIRLLGQESGWIRWIVDCPFIAEEC